MNETNWVKEKRTERDIAALEKAQRQERKKIDSKYLWHKINGRTKVLVECDEHGCPTKNGKEMLERYKKLFM